MRSALSILAVGVTLLMPLVARAATTPPWGDGRSQPEDLRVHLVTFGPGDEITAYFGHNALIVEDVKWRESRVYNYGMFSFGPDTLPKFLMGRLWFWVADTPTRPTMAYYRQMNRSIRLQTLNLSGEKKLQVAKFLADNVLPENRDYLYHHYFDNCATRVRDVIDDAVDGQFAEASQQPARMTLRDHTRRLSHSNVVVELVLMYWMNDEIDQPIQVWDEMFLPMELERRAAELEYVNDQGEKVPLVSGSRTLFEADRPPPRERPALMWPFTLLFGLLLGAVPVACALWQGRAEGARAPRVVLGIHGVTVGLIYGIPALALFLMATFTEHTVTYWNENLFLANPLTTLILPLGAFVIAGKPWSMKLMRWIGYLLAASGLLLIALKLLPMFDQANLLPITLILPVNLGLAAGYHLWSRSG